MNVRAFFAILLSVIVVGCSNGPSDTPPSDGVSDNVSVFRQVGYLKDNAKNRIFTIAYKPGTTEQEIQSHAEQLMNTQGQITAAYYYPEGSVIPADDVTLAGSVFKANNVLYDTPGFSKWHYAFMRHFKGTSEFVNCEKSPDNDLCRKQ